MKQPRVFIQIENPFWPHQLDIWIHDLTPDHPFAWFTDSTWMKHYHSGASKREFREITGTPQAEDILDEARCYLLQIPGPRCSPRPHLPSSCPALITLLAPVRNNCA